MHLPAAMFLLAWLSVGADANVDSLVVLPNAIVLSGGKASQAVLIERVAADEFVGQIHDGVTWTTADPKIAVVEKGVLKPVGNGATTLSAKVGGRVVSTPISVVGMEKPAAWSFRNHVQPVLSKGACNSGACHGALAGKKGFRLSLRGYDNEGDYNVLTRQAMGRRVSPADPARSLLLTKPTATLTHGGGKRFDIDSPDYQVVLDWIASGIVGPQESDPRIVSIEMIPPKVVLAPKAKQQFLVRARYSDGHVEDVTRWAKFTSTHADVAQVDDVGAVQVMGAGEGAITAWFLNKLVVATISVPYQQTVRPEAFTKAQRRNFVDEIVLGKLARLNLPPSPLCDDGEFLRRTFLDTLGILPTAEEARAFLADKSADKRDRLIEHVLQRPEFVDYWSYKFSDLLLVNSERLKPPAMWAYYNWIRSNVSANTPWDVMVRDLVTAQGSTLENGATNFYVLHPDTRELSETISVAFLGMSINCARCHNHPLEKWTNDEYFGMANLLSRVRMKDGAGEGAFTIFTSADGDIIQPLTGKAQPPRPLDGEALALDGGADRRAHLAKWLTAPTNPYFTRAIVNRTWANFLGVGLVEKVDDLRFTNPPSNPELLTALSHYVVDQKYDRKALMRLILQSATYQRSSQATAANAGDRRFYSRYYPKRLPAEILIDAISAVTGTTTDFAGYPPGWRAMQLPDTKVASYFLQRFGRPNRDITCECERTNEPNMVQVLHLSNGDTINKKLEAKNVLDERLAQKWSDEQIIQELYLAALTRLPSKNELEQCVVTLASAGAGGRRQAIEDLYWAVLTSKDFLFNH